MENNPALERIERILEEEKDDPVEAFFLEGGRRQFREFWARHSREIFRALRPKITDGLDQSFENLEYEEKVRVLTPIVEASLRAHEKDTHRQIPGAVSEEVTKKLIQQIAGLGQIQDFLEDPDISEIMVNGRDTVFIEKDGWLLKCDGESRDKRGNVVPACRFDSTQEIYDIIHRIISPLNRVCNASQPMVDARIDRGIAKGARVNAIVPPLAMDSPLLTIRKFRKGLLTVERLIEEKSMSPFSARFLETCVKAKLNIVVTGGTGSGKTTMLNILSGFIPGDERIITIEDSAELQLQSDHVLRLETKPASMDNAVEFKTRDLVRNALRMRPNRIVVGECRGGEALDMLQAMNTGHDGCLTTIHANSPHALPSRLETLVFMSESNLPIPAIRQQILDAIHIIVHIERLSDKTRRVVSIDELRGFKGGEGAGFKEIEIANLFSFQETGMEKVVQKDGSTRERIVGDLVFAGGNPRCLELIRRWKKDFSFDSLEKAG